jgi:hypothetical protein
MVDTTLSIMGLPAALTRHVQQTARVCRYSPSQVEVLFVTPAQSIYLHAQCLKLRQLPLPLQGLFCSIRQHRRGPLRRLLIVRPPRCRFHVGQAPTAAGELSVLRDLRSKSTMLARTAVYATGNVDTPQEPRCRQLRPGNDNYSMQEGWTLSRLLKATVEALHLLFAAQTHLIAEQRQLPVRHDGDSHV